MFEQSKSEGQKGKICKRRREEISKIISSLKDGEQYEQERAKRHISQIKTMGNGRFTNLGSNERLAQLPYDSAKFTDKNDQQSYQYGYFERGSRVLFGHIEKEKLSDEEIYKLGEADYYLKVPEEYLNILFKECPMYMQGYNDAKNIEETNKRSR